MAAHGIYAPLLGLHSSHSKLVAVLRKLHSLLPSTATRLLSSGALHSSHSNLVARWPWPMEMSSGRAVPSVKQLPSQQRYLARSKPIGQRKRRLVCQLPSAFHWLPWMSSCLRCAQPVRLGMICARCSYWSSTIVCVLEPVFCGWMIGVDSDLLCSAGKGHHRTALMSSVLRPAAHDQYQYDLSWLMRV